MLRGRVAVSRSMIAMEKRSVASTASLSHASSNFEDSQDLSAVSAQTLGVVEEEQVIVRATLPQQLETDKDDDEDSLIDMLDSMIADTSARWKASLPKQTLTSSTRASFESLRRASHETPQQPPPQPVQKQRRPVKVTQHPIAKDAPIPIIQIPTIQPAVDEITLDEGWRR